MSVALLWQLRVQHRFSQTYIENLILLACSTFLFPVLCFLLVILNVRMVLTSNFQYFYQIWLYVSESSGALPAMYSPIAVDLPCVFLVLFGEIHHLDLFPIYKVRLHCDPTKWFTSLWESVKLGGVCSRTVFRFFSVYKDFFSDSPVRDSDLEQLHVSSLFIFAFCRCACKAKKVRVSFVSV